MSANLVLTEKKGHVLKLTLNRPDKFNALNRDLQETIKNTLEEIKDSDEVRVVVLAGSPRVRVKDGKEEIRHVFSAGWDMSEAGKKFPQTIRVPDYIINYDKPLIAMVDGFALGGGCELALVCDFIFAAEEASFGLPEITRGFIPGWGGTQLLSRKIGLSAAKKMIFTGEHISGIEAGAIGLADVVVPRDRLDQEVMEFANKIANQAPLAIKRIKYVMDKGIGTDLATGLSLETEGSKYLKDTKDFKEGISAFLEKRTPEWTGQ